MTDEEKRPFIDEAKRIREDRGSTYIVQLLQKKKKKLSPSPHFPLLVCYTLSSSLSGYQIVCYFSSLLVC